MANKIADIHTVSPGEEESKFIFFEPNNPHLAVRAHEMGIGDHHFSCGTRIGSCLNGNLQLLIPISKKRYAIKTHRF